MSLQGVADMTVSNLGNDMAIGSLDFNVTPDITVGVCQSNGMAIGSLDFPMAAGTVAAVYESQGVPDTFSNMYSGTMGQMRMGRKRGCRDSVYSTQIRKKQFRRLKTDLDSHFDDMVEQWKLLQHLPLMVGTLKIALLATEDDPVYARNAVGLYSEFLNEAGSQLGVEVKFDEFCIKEKPDAYPGNYDEYHGVLITGNVTPIHAYDDIPWVHRLHKEIRHLHHLKKPLVGICFGHQNIAVALGGKVEKNPLGPQTAKQSFEPLQYARKMLQKENGDVSFFHYNCDAVTKLPTVKGCFPWAEISGTKQDTKNFPMYSIGNHILTIQGHPEFSTTSGRECLTQLLEQDFKAGGICTHEGLPKFDTFEGFQKFIKELMDSECGGDSKQIGKCLIAMMLLNNPSIYGREIC